MKPSRICDPSTVVDGDGVGDCGDVGAGVPALRSQLVRVMTRVRPEDLSEVEIAALLLVLVPALSRVIGGPAARFE